MRRSENHITAAYGTLADGATYLGCSVKTLRRLVDQGLPVYRRGRRGQLCVRFEAIDQWMESRRVTETDDLVDEILNDLKRGEGYGR